MLHLKTTHLQNGHYQFTLLSVNSDFNPCENISRSGIIKSELYTIERMDINRISVEIRTCIHINTINAKGFIINTAI